MDRYGYIYRTTNSINGKVYIGKHVKRSYDPNYLGSGYHLQNAIAKYGIQYFRVELICWAFSKKELHQLEIHHIFEHRRLYGIEAVYNITNGGDGGGFGLRDNHPLVQGSHKPDCSCMACRMIREEFKGSKNPAFGKKDSSETKLRRSIGQKQRIHQPDCKCTCCGMMRGENIRHKELVSV